MEKLISASSEFQRTLCLNEMTRERLRRLQVVLAGYLKFAFIALYPLALLPIIFVNNNSVSLPLLSFEISRLMWRGAAHQWVTYTPCHRMMIRNISWTPRHSLNASSELRPGRILLFLSYPKVAVFICHALVAWIAFIMRVNTAHES